MRGLDVARGAAFAGFVMLLAPTLDVALGGGTAGVAHAVVAGVGLAFLAVSAAADAGRG
jgi:hypothetical protein